MMISRTKTACVSAACGGPPRCEPLGEKPVDQILLRLVDFSLAGAIFAVPLFMGGRHPLGQFLLVALAFFAAICWCLRQSLTSRAVWIRSPLDWLLLAAPLLIGVQLVTLSPSLIESVAGHVYEILPLWAPQSRDIPSLGVWKTLSLAPTATRDCLVLVVAMTLLAAVTLQRVRELEDVERLVRWIACSVLIVATFGVIQYLTTNGRFFWFYEHAEADTRHVVKGCFPNPNHFAQFLALGIGPLIWWIQHRIGGYSVGQFSRSMEFEPSPHRIDLHAGLLAIALAGVVFAGLMSQSRGGALVIFAASGVCLLVLYWGRRVQPKMLLAAVGVGGLIVAGLFVHGFRPVAQELAELGSFESLDRNAIRRHLWMADLRAAAQYPLTGTGLGSHRDVNPAYFRDESMGRLEYTHAESGYVQVAMETGAAGTLLLLCAVGIPVYCCVAALRRGLPPRSVIALAAVAAGLAASLIHSLVDFVWYIPGCMVAVIVMAACACRLWQFAAPAERQGQSESALSRTVWLAAAGCLAAVGCFAVKDRLAAVRAEPAWHNYVLLEKTASRGSLTKLTPETLQTMADDLETTLRWLPDHGEAQAALAEVHLAMFEQGSESIMRQGGVKGVRDAAIASRFESPKALREWLDRAFPERWHHLEAAWKHAHLAARCSPLEGEAYLFLANVPFFDGPKSPGTDGYVAQALRVRPHDGYVLFEAGREALLAGEPAKAFELWQQSYQSGPVAQRQLEDFLAGVVPTAAFIEVFKPNRLALKRMVRLYRQKKLPPEVISPALEHYATALQNDARTLDKVASARLWQEAAAVFQSLENPVARLACLRNAVAGDPGCFETRHMLGTCLFEMGEYSEAEENLRWCVQWKPGDKKLREELEAAMDRRLRLGSLPEQAPSR